MSFAARFERAFAWFAPSPMITPRSAAFADRRRVRVGGDEDQLVEDRRSRRDRVVIAIQRLRVEAALDDAAGDELGDGLEVASRVASGVSQTASDGRVTAAEPVLRGGADVEDRLAVEVARGAGADRHEPSGRGSRPARRAPR